MPENDFEKQMQEKMDDLQLEPSTQVWVEVEKHIRKEKKRRFPVIWFWLTGLLLTGATSYFIFRENSSPKIGVSNERNEMEKGIEKSNGSKKTITETETGDQQTNSREEENGNSSSTTSTLTEENSTTKGIIRDSGMKTTPADISSVKKTNKPASSIDPQGDGIATKRTNKPLNSRTIKNPSINNTSTHARVRKEEGLQQPSAVHFPKPKDENVDRSLVSNPDNKKPEEVKNQETVTNPAVASGEFKKVITEDAVIAKEEKPVDSAELKPAMTQEVNPEKAVSMKKTDNGWKFGIELKAGISNTRSGGLFGSPVTYDNLQSGGGVSNPGNVFTSQIPEPGPGFSNGIGLMANRSISSKFDLQIGLHYEEFRTRSTVGGRVDSFRLVSNIAGNNVGVNNFYLPPAGQDAKQGYTNNFRFLGLSAGISWKLIQRKRFSLTWDNTIAYSGLVSGDVLQFSNAINGYYNDFGLYQKNQVFYRTGFSIPVINKRAFTLSVNPFASFGITKTIKEDKKNPRFVNYGLGIKIMSPF